MSLDKYIKKRNINSSHEPKGNVKKIDKNVTNNPAFPIFVVQKHAASHLHYDFRLEVAGVLKSWAVPKGPSLNPKEKHLAIMVEDHPYDYHDFEGIIPEGNYGAGTVMVWDAGNYTPLDDHYELGDAHTMKESLKKGKIHVFLNGKKLKGIFSLVKMKQVDNKENWILIKVKDEFASDDDILKKDKSVLTNRTMQQIAKQV